MASDCRSERKRSKSSSSYRPTLISLRATWRCTGAVCSASQTCPMPPSPSRHRSLYGPMNLGSESVGVVVGADAELATVGRRSGFTEALFELWVAARLGLSSLGRSSSSLITALERDSAEV